MSKFKKIILIFTFVLLGFIAFVLLAFSIYLANRLDKSETDLKSIQPELIELKKSASEYNDFLDYVYNLEKYDSQGAKKLPFTCYEPKRPENMSSKDQFWYDAGPHDPPFPTDNNKINLIQSNLKKDRSTEAYKICESPTKNDFLVVYRSETDIADLYRFNKDMTYTVHNVSSKFDGFDVLSWLDNGDIIYTPSAYSESILVYVFTANNKDILLEYCGVKDNMADTKTFYNYENLYYQCKLFNNITSTSKYLDKKYIDSYQIRRTF